MWRIKVKTEHQEFEVETELTDPALRLQLAFSIIEKKITEADMGKVVFSIIKKERPAGRDPFSFESIAGVARDATNALYPGTMNGRR